MRDGAPERAAGPDAGLARSEAGDAIDAIEAATFRRLLAHLDAHNEVQNIDLMNLAHFCRNCLAKWYRAEAAERGVELSDAAARERIYGMPYPEWKALHQKELPAGTGPARPPEAGPSKA